MVTDKNVKYPEQFSLPTAKKDIKPEASEPIRPSEEQLLAKNARDLKVQIRCKKNVVAKHNAFGVQLGTENHKLRLGDMELKYKTNGAKNT